MLPTHSIVIPVFNTARWLPGCLDSVAAQRGDWECVCVDDGSTDGSGGILDARAAIDGRFRVIHKENGGPGSARNVGLDAARGEWISFVDSDDVLSPDYLSVFDAVPDKADVVFFQLVRTDGDGVRHNIAFPGSLSSTPRSSQPEIESLACGLVFNERRTDMLGWTCNKFIRRSLVESSGARFDVSVRCYEDELFALAILAKARSVALLPRCLYRYRWRADCLTASREAGTEDLADPYERAMGAFRSDAFLSLQFSRVFHLRFSTFVHSPTKANFSRLVGFWARRRHFLHAESRRFGLALDFANIFSRKPPEPVVAFFAKRFAKGAPRLLCSGGANPTPFGIDTFFV